MSKIRPKVSLIQLLAGNNFLQVNRSLCKDLGVIPAIILSEMCSMYTYFSQIGELVKINDSNDWFYLTIDDIEEKLGISRRTQNDAIETLIKEGLIEYKRHGLPAKRYFRINQENLLTYFSVDSSRDSIVESNSSYSLCETHNLECAKRTNPIYIIPDITISDLSLSVGSGEQNDKNSSKPERPPSKSAPPPNLEKPVELSVGSDEHGEKIFYKNMGGRVDSISKSEVYRHFSSLGYSTETISAAIARMQKLKRVNTPLPLLEKICEEIVESKRNADVAEKKKKIQEVPKEEKVYPPPLSDAGRKKWLDFLS